MRRYVVVSRVPCALLVAMGRSARNSASHDRRPAETRMMMTPSDAARRFCEGAICDACRVVAGPRREKAGDPTRPITRGGPGSPYRRRQ